MATRYWGPGGNGLWSSTTNWSSFSTGTPTGASVPGSGDLVVFNSSSGSGTATIDTNFTIQSLTMTGFTGTLAFGTNTLTLIRSGAVFTGSSSYNVTGTPVINIDNNTSLATTLAPGNTTEANSISFNIISGTYVLTFSSSGNFKNLNFTGFSGSTSSIGGRTIYGNLTLSSTSTLTTNGTLVFGATSGVQTITSAGSTLDCPININCGVSVTVQVTDALTMGLTRAITHYNGIFDLNGKTVTIGNNTGAYTTGAGTKVLLFNGGTLVNPGTNATAFNNVTPTGFSTVAGTGTGKISMTGATAKTFVGGGSTYNCTLSNDGAGALTITGANTFTTLANGVQPTTFTFTAGTTTTVTNFNLSGASGSLVTINSATAATHTLSKASGTVLAQYLSITNSIATGGATWYAANSTNVSGNSGWIFGVNKYWVGGTGSWATAARWSTSSGGAGGSGINIADNAVFDAASGSGTSTVSSNFSVQMLTMTGYTGTLAFGTNTISLTTTTSSTVFTGDATYSVSGTPVINITNSTANALTLSPGTTLTEANTISFNITAGTYALTIPALSRVRNLNFTGYSGSLTSSSLTIYGDLNLGTTATFLASTSAWTFASTNATARTITTNSKTLDRPLTFNGVNGAWQLVDALTMGSTRTLTHTNGTIDLNGKTLTVGTQYTTAAGTKNLTFNGGTLVCPNSNTTSFNNAASTNYTTTAGTGTGVISMTSASSKTFVGGGSTFNCTVSNGGNGGLTISGNNIIDTLSAAAGTSTNITGSNTITTFSNGGLGYVFTFTAGTTQTITNWNANGSVGNSVSLQSATPGSIFTLSKSSGVVSGDYLVITDSTATGGATWYAGPLTHSIDGGNNSGWIFTAAPTSTGNFFLLF